MPIRNPYLLASHRATVRWVQRFIPSDWCALMEEAAQLETGTGAGAALTAAGLSVPAGGLFVPTPLQFKPYEPTVFWEHEGGIPFRGQEMAKDLLQLMIDTTGARDRLKALLVGSAGSGKTTLAWITAKRLLEKRPGRFFELLSTQVAALDQFVAFVRGLQPGDVVFIDEIHIIPETIGVEPLLHVLGDTGVPRLKAGREEYPVPPNVSWIGATTDPGRMDKTTGGALRRRFDPILRLEAPTTETLVEILLDQQMEIRQDAAWDIAERSNGLPWAALAIYRDCVRVATRDAADEIIPEHVHKVFKMRQIDEHGLGPDHRAVLRTVMRSPTRLANGELRFSMAADSVCAASGVDQVTYRKEVQPTLLNAGLLTTQGGQTLTEKALRAYANLAVQP